jgi:hypothetical protein
VVGLSSDAFAVGSANSGRGSTALCCGNSKGPVGSSPHAAKAWEAHVATKIPALKVIVIAREIVFMKFLFLPRVNPAYNLKGAIRDRKLAAA